MSSATMRITISYRSDKTMMAELSAWEANNLALMEFVRAGRCKVLIADCYNGPHKPCTHAASLHPDPFADERLATALRDRGVERIEALSRWGSLSRRWWPRLPATSAMRLDLEAHTTPGQRTADADEKPDHRCESGRVTTTRTSRSLGGQRAVPHRLAGWAGDGPPVRSRQGARTAVGPSFPTGLVRPGGRVAAPISTMADGGRRYGRI